MVIRKILFILCLFLLVLPLAYSLKITTIFPANNSVIAADSTWINISLDMYGNCTYSLDSKPFASFSNSKTSNWKVGTSNHLELSQDGSTSDNVETLRNITTYIDKNNLRALASGSVTNNKTTSLYNQYLYVLGPGAESALDTGYVLYTEEDDDITADFLYFKSGREIGRYLLEFTTPFQSGIFDNDSNPSQLGLNLKDFKNATLKIFGNDYKIIEAKRTSPNENGIRLIFANKTADAPIKSTFFLKDTLYEGQTSSYTIKVLGCIIISVFTF